MFKRFLAYYKPHKKMLALDMAASFLIALIGMGYPILTRVMLNTWIPEENLTLILIGSLGLLFIYIARMGLRYFIQYYGHVMGVHMQAEMRKDLFLKLQKLPYSYFDEHETGTILSTMSNDLFDISELAHHGPENLLIAGFTIIGAFVYLLLINWILGLVLLVMLPIIGILTYHFRKKFHQSMRASKRAIAKINAALESSITGIRVTKAFVAESKEQEKFDESNQGYIDARTSVFHSMGQFFSVSQFITDFFNVLILVLGGVLISLHIGDFDYADYATFVVSISLVISPIDRLISFMEQFESASAGFERFCAVIDETEETAYEGSETLTSLEGELSFEHVSFHYASSPEKGVLHDVSFTLEKGKTLALVGPSGGGKTTICHLIPRFYFLEEGRILLDGKDISQYTLSSLRSSIGIVQQDVFLFGGTIKENIAYGKLGASDDEILEAARKANILEYIESLPKGWDTEIGERGVRLSGGQKQRLSIARVFLKNPSILILDEATSALDNATEMLIQQSLEELSKGRTTIVVAHRLSTIKHADEIMVISEGEIKERGSHEELLEQGGAYKSLYELQFRPGEDVSSLKIG